MDLLYSHLLKFLSVMDGCSSSGSPPSDATYPAAGSTDGPSKFLADLPSRGFFSSTVLSSNLGGMRAYICDHDTSPPDDQVIQTNQTNILVRSLMLKNQKGDSSSKDVKGTAANQGSRKRVAEKALDKAEGKKPTPTAQLPLRVAEKALDKAEGTEPMSSDQLPFRIVEKALLDKAEGKKPMSNAQLASLPESPSSELRRIKKDLKRHSGSNALRWGRDHPLDVQIMFRHLKTDQIRLVLKERGLSIKGKRGELIARLRSV